MTADLRSCPHCHKPIAVDAHFCANCGTPTPTEPGVPARTMPTGAFEVSRVRTALSRSYQIERVLGEGGMATVYLAEDLKHHRKVAVKVMRPELAATLGAERFLREVEIAARMNHQNILPVFDSGAIDGILYYVMPVVEGESLPARIAREKQLPVGEALQITREVAEALAYAHKRGIIHRDIKPANILIHEGHALVSDFGIARATENASALTGTGLAIGTPAYMSPEQASGDSNLDGRTDIYALGCVLYEMLAGEPPFTGPTAQAIITRSITEEPRPLTRTRAAIPAAVDSAVLTALAKAPADRYATAGAMVDALIAAEVEGRSSAAQATSSIAHRPATPWWKFAVAAVVVLVLGVGGMKAFGGGRATAPASTSVAILPFVSQGSDADVYFADGIVDEVRNRLARVDRLVVIASSSADQYRGTTKPAVDIARELRVDQVLMGTVRWATGPDGAKRFSVTAELVNGTTGQVSWRDTFTGDLTDPFTVQARVATRVASALGTALAPAEANALAAAPTTNAEAYALYLKGMAIVRGTAASYQQKAALYEQAVALDSTFAQAWSVLARVNISRYGSFGHDPLAARRAKQALDRALQLAPDVASTYVTAFSYSMVVAKDSVAARHAVARALELEPRGAESLVMASDLDKVAGDTSAALTKLALARQVDPRSSDVLSRLFNIYSQRGQTDEAIAVGDELVGQELTPMSTLQSVIQLHIASNDLPGAKAAVRQLLERMAPTELVPYFAGYGEMAYLFDESERALLFRLTPAAFGGDVVWWGQSLAIAAMQQGDTARARAYADSSLTAGAAQVDSAPHDPQLRMLNAVMLGYAGRTAEARREASRAMADTTGISRDIASYVLQQQIRLQLRLGETEAALDNLESLMRERKEITPGYLRIEPMFRVLDRNPRFQRLLNQGIGRPVD